MKFKTMLHFNRLFDWLNNNGFSAQVIETKANCLEALRTFGSEYYSVTKEDEEAMVELMVDDLIEVCINNDIDYLKIIRPFD